MLWLKGCAVVGLILIIAMFKMDHGARVWATIGVVALMGFAYTQKNKK